jgi:hypothetical protein
MVNETMVSGKARRIRVHDPSQAFTLNLWARSAALAQEEALKRRREEDLWSCPGAAIFI